VTVTWRIAVYFGDSTGYTRFCFLLLSDSVFFLWCCRPSTVLAVLQWFTSILEPLKPLIHLGPCHHLTFHTLHEASVSVVSPNFPVTVTFDVRPWSKWFTSLLQNFQCTVLSTGIYHMHKPNSNWTFPHAEYRECTCFGFNLTATMPLYFLLSQNFFRLLHINLKSTMIKSCGVPLTTFSSES